MAKRTRKFPNKYRKVAKKNPFQSRYFPYNRLMDVTLLALTWVEWPNVGKLLASTCVQEIDVSFLCVCPVIDHESRHNIVKVAVDPRGDSRVDPHEFQIHV